MQPTHLSNRDAHTMQQLFQHPTSQQVEWNDVVELMKHLGTVVEENNGHLLLTVNGVSQVLHRSQTKEITDVQEILDLRHFLEGARHEEKATGTALELRLLVVINRKEALIFRSLAKDSVPERLHPYDPEGALNRLIHTEGVDKAARAPENLTYYQEIATTLTGATEVLLMGNGTGASSAMTHLNEFLSTHHPEIARSIVGSLTLDLEALPEEELLQNARTFFLTHTATGL